MRIELRLSYRPPCRTRPHSRCARHLSAPVGSTMSACSPGGSRGGHHRWRLCNMPSLCRLADSTRHPTPDRRSPLELASSRRRCVASDLRHRRRSRHPRRGLRPIDGRGDDAGLPPWWLGPPRPPARPDPPGVTAARPWRRCLQPCGEESDHHLTNSRSHGTAHDRVSGSCRS